MIRVLSAERRKVHAGPPRQDSHPGRRPTARSSPQSTNASATGQLTLGKHGAAFEEAFAQTAGTKHAIATSSGTSALEIIFRSDRRRWRRGHRPDEHVLRHAGRRPARRRHRAVRRVRSRDLLRSTSSTRGRCSDRTTRARRRRAHRRHRHAADAPSCRRCARDAGVAADRGRGARARQHARRASPPAASAWRRRSRSIRRRSSRPARAG